MSIDTAQTVLWKFIRNDISMQDFETWFYSNKDLEKLLGSDLYLELLLFDYQKNDQNKKSKSASEIQNLKCLIYSFLSQTPCACLCPMLPDHSWVDFYLGGYCDQKVLTKLEESLQIVATIRDIQKPKDDTEHSNIHYDVAELRRCHVCQQYWFLFYNYGSDYFLIRLNELEAHTLRTNNDWPNIKWPPHLQDGRSLQKIPFQSVGDLYGEFPVPPYQQFLKTK